MAEKTHQERVRDEIVRQWPDRVKARADLIQRPLGLEDISLDKARELWWQTNPKAAPAIAQSQGMGAWDATKLLYPYREPLLQAARQRGGVKEMIRFSDMMNRRGGEA